MRLIREIKEFCGRELYAARMSVQNEHVPLLFHMVVHMLEDKNCIGAAQILMDLNINVEQFKEHLMGLIVRQHCLYDDLSVTMKANFAKEYNTINMNTIKQTTKPRRKPAAAGTISPSKHQQSLAQPIMTKFDPDI